MSLQFHSVGDLPLPFSSLSLVQSRVSDILSSPVPKVFPGSLFSLTRKSLSAPRLFEGTVTIENDGVTPGRTRD